MSDARRKCAAKISQILGDTLRAEMDGPYGDDAMPVVDAASIVDASDAIAALLTEERTKALSEREAEIVRLREALEPFAALLPAIEGHMGTPQTGELMMWERRTGSYSLTVEHLKAARAALSRP